jgi:hypothetical protein
MKKTREFEIAEAYEAGFQAALREVPEAVKHIDAWKSQPENQLVMSIRDYIRAMLDEYAKSQR